MRWSSLGLRRRHIWGGMASQQQNDASEEETKSPRLLKPYSIPEGTIFPLEIRKNFSSFENATQNRHSRQGESRIAPVLPWHKVLLLLSSPSFCTSAAARESTYDCPQLSSLSLSLHPHPISPLPSLPSPHQRNFRRCGKGFFISSASLSLSLSSPAVVEERCRHCGKKGRGRLNIKGEGDCTFQQGGGG